MILPAGPMRRRVGDPGAALAAAQITRPAARVVNAIRYVTRSGAQWRMVPRDLVPWGTGWSYFRRGTGSGCTTIHERRSVGPPFAIRTHPPADPGQPVRQDGRAGGAGARL